MASRVEALVDAASRPYLAAGRYAYHYARGKLVHDPFFLALLRAGRIPDRSRVLDLGCGQAILASLLLAARAQHEAGSWPAGWAVPPSGLRLHGIEFSSLAVRRAQAALGGRATIEAGDLRDVSLPDADVVVLADVLHYLSPAQQDALLGKVAQTLRGGGLLVLRVADASAGWRFHAGKTTDWLGTLLSGGNLTRQHHRPVAGWMALLGELGFGVGIEPPGRPKSFANVLLWASADPAARLERAG
ncbi:MAG TPA: class I SAM-dependent methyltransferase [Burkholderiales bacterium]|nr:class I SAM-dependent methyltransferase [Burkholderiales bacterium]